MISIILLIVLATREGEGRAVFDLTSFPTAANANAQATEKSIEAMMAKYFDQSFVLGAPSQQSQGSSSPPYAAKQHAPTPAPAPALTPAPTPAPASSLTPAPASSTNSNLQDVVLMKHNNLRANHQASPLSWSSALAADALSWADGCVWGNSNAQGQGENLAIGYDSVATSIQAWANEEQYYNYEEVTSDSSYFEKIGHFTQMVWIATTEVGCATAQCPWQGVTATYLVCRYTPPGNVLGEFQANVKPPN